MKLSRKVGVTSEIWQIFIADSSSTTGAGLTGLAFNSASLAAYYHRDTDTTATPITLATMTVGTYTSSGFKEIDSLNMPGWYQFCPPNAALATGAKNCGFHLKGATNMAPLPIEVDLQSDVNVTHWAGTAVATPATAGIPDVNAKNWNNLATVALPLIPTVAGRALDVSAGGEAGLDWANIGSKTTLNDLTGTTINGASIGNAVWSNIASPIIAAGAVVSSTSTTLTADTSFTADNVMVGCTLVILSGTGASQARVITAWNNSTSTYTIDRPWAVNPAAADALYILWSANPSIDANLKIKSVVVTDTVTNQLTAAAIATGVWQDTTAGDFTVAGSIGKSLGGAFTSLGTSVYSSGALANAPSAPTAAAIATAVWQDTTSGDFTTASSIGKSLYNAFTSNTSVFTTASLVNAPSGGSAPTAAAIATAVWQDTTSGDFTVTSSIGKLLYNIPAFPANFSDLAITVTTGRVTAGTVADKTGYTLTQAFPTNFAALGITGAGKISEVVVCDDAITVTQIWSAGARTLTSLSGLTVDTVTTLTNLPSIPANWITAAGIATDAITAAKIADNAIDSATFAAGTTIPRCTLVDTLTTYTGDTPQSGDAFALIGTAGAGLTALGDTRIAHLDANVSSRMATYTQPAGFLAATFPLIVCPSILATNAITAGSIATSALNSKGDWLLSSSYTAPDNSSIAAIKAKTDLIPAAGPASKADVVDALETDTYTLPGQIVPPATTSIRKMLSYLYKSWRNKKDNNGSQTNLYDDAGTTVDQIQSTTEAGGVVTKGKWGNGP